LISVDIIIIFIIIIIIIIYVFTCHVLSCCDAGTAQGTRKERATVSPVVAGSD